MRNCWTNQPLEAVVVSDVRCIIQWHIVLLRDGLMKGNARDRRCQTLSTFSNLLAPAQPDGRDEGRSSGVFFGYIHMGMLSICIFRNGCCATALPKSCGVFTGRMKEEKATLVDKSGRISLEVIMNQFAQRKAVQSVRKSN